MNRKTLFAPISYMLFIFILSSIPAHGHKLGGFIYINSEAQNILHIPLFGLLTLLWIRAFNGNKMAVKKTINYAALITLLYAAFDEFHQYFVPGRYASISDFGLDAIGCFAALCIFIVINLRNTHNAIRDT